jgi:sodium/potassium-transporting ATPase subunit alpha
MQYGGLLAVRNRRVSILNSNPLWGPRRNLAVPAGMLATALIGVANLYGPGLQNVFLTTPIPSKFWGIPFGFALGILIMDETRKLIVRSYPKVCIIYRLIFFFAHPFYFIIVNHREDGLVVIRN